MHVRGSGGGSGGAGWCVGGGRRSSTGRERPAPLPRVRVLVFDRKARAYRNAYAKFDTPRALARAAAAGGSSDYKLIEKFLKEAKTHRCTLDQDWALVTGDQESGAA